MNHFSPDIPQAIWWTQKPFMEPIPHQQNHLSPPHHHRRTTAASFNFNLNQDELRHENLPDEREKDTEPMFEKPLTPSDVGKLNRLVIPKQHAEKYFPLGPGGDSAGSLLSFEDESGKPWRFRYSYWNSSQSYVLTKGWSRFVKEKRLDAGDIVLFERHRSDGGRLFIRWRRKPDSVVVAAQPGAVADNCGGGGWRGVCYSAHAYPLHPSTTDGGHGPTIPYQPDCLHAGTVVQNQTPPSGNSKRLRLRLFGVNLECQPDHESEPSIPDGYQLLKRCQPCEISPRMKICGCDFQD